MGVEPRVQSRWLNAVSAYLTPEQVEAVRTLPFVRGIRPVGGMAPVDETARPLVEAPSLPLVPHRLARRLDYGLSQTQLARVNALPPLERGLNGSGVRLGIIDTGLGDLATHPAFDRMLAEERFLESRDFTGQPDDGSRHGRSVLSVAAGFDEGALIGPGYGAEILHARTEYTPTETNQEEDNFVAGLEWMEAEGVDVVNVSLGYSEFDAGQHSYTPDDMDGDTPVTTQAADRAAQLGVVVVVSAGNSGNDAWRIITSPADGDSVITVGAVDANGLKASFSSFGPTADGRIKPDVSAQGVSVYLANAASGYGFSNGTSFSAPMVSGLVTLLLQVNPALTPVQVRDVLRQTASQSTSPDNSLGWGIVDAEAAVALAEALATGVDEVPAPDAVEVDAYPLPATDRAVVAVRVPAPVAQARLSVYDLLGRRIAMPYAGPLPPGLSRLPIDLTGLPAGVYLYTLHTPKFTRHGRLVVTR